MPDVSIDQAEGALPNISKVQVQLPAGGGTIRSPIETIGLSGYTGAAQFRIPLNTVPCRSFEPKAALTYSSSNGNSVFGLGFDLALSSIAVRTASGIPHYDGNDVFSLDGDTLVPLAKGRSVRTENGIAYEVTSYGMRVQAAGTRVERFDDGAEGSFWRVLGPDGGIHVYGKSAAARIADPTAPRRVFAWLIEEEFDPKGNARLTRYKRENRDNVDRAIYEHNREVRANLYPERICYGNATPLFPADGGLGPLGAVDWHFELVFDYGEYDVAPGNDDPYTPVRSWPARPDPFSSYAAAFERRTYRLCRGLMMFNRFTAELGSAPVLTDVLRLAYDESAAASRLKSATRIGYRHRPGQPTGQRYAVRALPATEFAFVAFDPAVPHFTELTADNGKALPGLQDSPSWSLIDLYGEGLPGVLYADGTTTRYWNPAKARVPDRITYIPAQPQAFPSPRRVDGQGLQLESIEGNGVVNLVDLVAGGEFAFSAETGSKPLRRFDAYPTGAALADSRGADLSGTGLTDRIGITGAVISVMPSAGLPGFAPAVQRLNPHHLPPTAGAQKLIMFADPLAAGGQHYVRIANGNITVWPNLGYGNFAEPVSMGGVPLYSGFDADRVRLADIDGSGALAFAYVSPNRVDIYRNLSGNRFADVPIVVPLPVTCGSADQVSFSDVRGNGYSCLVITTQDPEPRQWFCDLCNGSKPYLLSRIDDQLGAVTTLSYVSSTHFYLKDKQQGLPWITSLPFPVQVLRQIDTVDGLSATHLTQSFAYHHGAYDEVEREFRGFGYIETREEQTPGPLAQPRMSASVADGAAIGIPKLTRSWYDIGAWELEPKLLAQYHVEWFDGDADAFRMPSPVFDWNGLPADARTQRQARVALAGSLIHQEVYGIDGAPNPDIPYTVEMQNFTVQLLQPAAKDRYAIFTTHVREEMTLTYDRVADDPLARHRFTLALNAYNQIERAASIAYGRRNVPGALPEQLVTWAACDVMEYTPAINIPDVNLAPLVAAAATYALVHLPPPDVDGLYYSFATVSALVAKAISGSSDAELTSRTRFEWMPAGGTIPVTGAPAPQALLLQRHEAAFTPTAITGLFGALPVPGGLDGFLMAQGGYRLENGYWWKSGARASYAPGSGFYLVQAIADPFVAVPESRGGTTTSYGYDPHDLIITSTTMASSNGDTADETSRVDAIDYQKLAPVRLTEPNGTIRELVADPLGAVVATSFRGQEFIAGKTVLKGFAPLPIDDPSSWPTAASLADFMTEPGRYLNGAAQAYHYDSHAWRHDGEPSSVATAKIPAFTPAVGPSPADLIEIAVLYSDGTGRTLATVSKVEPGDAFLTAQWQGGSTPPPWGYAANRWRVGSRSRLNSTGEPFRTYQPCYVDTYRFIGDAELETFDLAVSRTFDALGRVVRTDYPKAPFEDAFYATEHHGAWAQVSADQDDTVKSSRYYTYYVVDGHPLPKYEREALLRAAELADTPTTLVRDSLGRTIRSIALLREGTVTRELATHSSFDIAGRLRWTADPRLAASGKHNFDFIYAMTGEVLKTIGCDAGTRFTLSDIAGLPIYTFDGNGASLIGVHDSRGRLTASEQLPPDATSASVPVVAERRIYGDSLDGAGKPVHDLAEGRNLFGVVTVSYDNAGRVGVPAYGLSGAALMSGRRFCKTYEQAPTWNAMLATGWTWADLFAILDATLQAETYPQDYSYDALGRSTGVTLPDQSVLAQAYHVSGRLARIAMGVAGAASRPILLDASYSARERRERRTLAGTDAKPLLSRQDTFDPDTGQLKSIRSTRSSDGVLLQDLSYFQDPVGNVVHIADAAAPSQRVMANGQVVTPDLDYTYDSLYRLVSASGRAMKGLTAAAEREGGYQPFFSTQDPTAVENYTQRFGYDDGNNLMSLAYQAPSSAFTTALAVDDSSNRAYDFDGHVPSVDPFAGLFDHNGNQIKLSGTSGLAWTRTNNLASVILVERPHGTPDAEYYAYDSGGNRVRKVWQSMTAGGLQTEETLYCGALEIWRRSVGGAVVEETHRLRVLDGGDSLCQHLSWTVGAPPAASAAGTRYQLSNGLNSALTEVDEQARVASYEEYAPYGATVYAAAASLTEMRRKEYRYNGRQRDKATGLTYYGARYAAPWLGRWMNPDPVGPVDGLNLFAFVSDNPSTSIDVNGMCKKKKTSTVMIADSDDESSSDDSSDDSSMQISRIDDGSGHVGAISDMSFSLEDAETNYFELSSSEITGLTSLVDRLNRVTTASSTGKLDIINEHEIRRVFRDMAPNNFGINEAIHPLWEEANKGEDTSRKYTLLRRGMTPVLQEDLPDTYSSDFFRKPEIHHATYQSVVREWENTPQNLYLVTRGGRGIIGQHDALHLISSAGHGSQWKTLVPSIRSVVEDETGMKLMSSGSRPEYLFAPRQVELTDDRVSRTNTNKLLAEAIASADSVSKSPLQTANWTFRMTRL
jgi:insecticidal toxin complex protein TccC